MPVSLHVAAAQIACAPSDVNANLAAHLAMIGEARGRGVDLLVFPELSLTGYLAAPDVLALARSRDAPEMLRLAEAAGGMMVAVGFIEEAPGALFHNAAALLRDGRVLHVHRKANLPTYGGLEEGKHYARGAGAAAVAPLGGPWTAATLICADLWNPALPWLAALAGATLLLAPIASALGGVDAAFDNPGGWDLVLRHAALVHGLPIVMANHAAMPGGPCFWGGSRILDAHGAEIARAGEEPALVTARLDYADVRRARFRLPTRRDSSPESVHAALSALLGETGRDA